MWRGYLNKTGKFLVRSVLAAALLLTPGCIVRRVTRIHPSKVPPQAITASLADLAVRLNSRSESIHTLTATVDLEPSAGSIYSGIIKEYHDVRGFVLLEKPGSIRIQGQAPVVRTTIFDIVSTGDEFRVYIPPKQKFIVGKTTSRRPAKNSLEKLRPQHILEAMLVQGLDASHEKWFMEEAEEDGHRYYVITIVEASNSEQLRLNRKAWFDRADLSLARMQFYEQDGTYAEDVHYYDYQDYEGVNYPSRIELVRPIEDYRLAITIMKAVFNQPIAPEKFVLNRPEGAELVDLTAKAQQENPRGQ